MYYHRSRSPSRGRSSNNYRGLSSYNSLNSDLALSNILPRNRSVQRVRDSDFVRPERTRSPMRDYTSTASFATSFRPLSSSLSSDSSPVLKRRELGLTSSSISDQRSSPVNWLSTDDYLNPSKRSLLSTDDYTIPRKRSTLSTDGYTIPTKPRSYYDFPSTSSSRYTSYSSTSLRRPQRTDYSDYFRPVLISRPTLMNNYTPRPRAERESVAMPIVRERKLIKFRETANDIKTKRKISWDLPEEIDSPLINEMRMVDELASEAKHLDSLRNRDSSLTRYESKEASPRERSLTRYESKDVNSQDGNRRDSGSSSASASRRSSDHSIDRMSPRSLLRLKSPRKSNLDPDDLKLSPVPRKKSIGPLPKGKNHRKSSLESSDEKRLKHSIVAEKIRKGKESPDHNLVENLRVQNSDASNKSEKWDQETFQQTDMNLIPDVIPETTDDRSRRRRRYGSDAYSEQDKLEDNARSRCRSRVQSTQEPEFTIHNSVSSFGSEEVRPLNRMQRKYVECKTEQPLSNQFSKLPQEVLVPGDNAEEIEKKGVYELLTVDSSISGKLKHNVDPNGTTSEVSQALLNDKSSKENTDKITMKTNEQTSSAICVMESNQNQIKTKKTKKKDGIKGGYKTNLTNSVDTQGLNETNIVSVQSLDPQISIVTESCEEKPTQKTEVNSKSINDLKKDVVTTLSKTNASKETNLEHIPDLLKKLPSTNSNDIQNIKTDENHSKMKQLKSLNSIPETKPKLDKLEISDLKNLDTKVQLQNNRSFNESKKPTSNSNANLKTTTTVINKTINENKCLNTNIQSNSKSVNTVSETVEKQGSEMKKSVLDDASNETAITKMETKASIAASDYSKNKYKTSIASELKEDFKKNETKKSEKNSTENKKPETLFPSLTNKSKNLMDTKDNKNNKFNKISIEESIPKINANKVTKPDSVGIKKNSQVVTNSTTPLSDTGNTDATSTTSNTATNKRLPKIGDDAELQVKLTSDKSDISRINFPDVAPIDVKPICSIANKQSSPRTTEKVAISDNKNLEAHASKINKVTTPSVEEAKVYKLSHNLMDPNTKSQTNSKYQDDLTNNAFDNTTNNNKVAGVKSLNLEKDRVTISEPKTSENLTQSVQKVKLVSSKQPDTQNTSTIKNKQPDKSNTTLFPQVTPKPLKVKTTSEITDSNKTVSPDKDQREIVVVCKLPPPLKKEPLSAKNDLPDDILIDQSLIVSLRKSTKLHVLSKHFDPITKHKTRALPIISNQSSFVVPKEANKIALTSVNEEPETLPEVVNQNLNTSESNTNTKMKLKSIPDIIQSSIKPNSETNIVNKSKSSTSTDSIKSINEPPLVLPNINEKMSEISDLKKTDILGVKRTVEEPLNKLPILTKQSVAPTQTEKPQIQSTTESNTALNKAKEISNKLPEILNDKDNTTYAKKSDIALPKTDLPNKKQTKLKSTTVEGKSETSEVSSHVLEKTKNISVTKNISDVKTSNTEVSKKKLESDLSKPNILLKKEVGKEVENKNKLFSEEKLNKTSPEQDSKMNLNKDVKVQEQQTKSKTSNSYVKLPQLINKSEVVSVEGKTMKHIKTQIIDSDVKVQEQVKSTDSNIDITAPVQQQVPKFKNLESKLPEQTQSKTDNSKAKLPEKQKIAKPGLKGTEQLKIINSGVEVQEDIQKTKIVNSKVNIPEEKVKTASSDVKIQEQCNESKAVISNIKPLEQQVNSTTTKYNEKKTDSKILTSDKSKKTEDNVYNIKFKDTEKNTEEADLSPKTSKPSNVTSRLYKRSSTTPNVDTILDSSSTLIKKDKSLSSSNTPAVLLQTNKSFSSDEIVKSVKVEESAALIKNVKSSISKVNIQDACFPDVVQITENDKILSGQNNRFVINDVKSQSKVSDQLSVKENLGTKTNEIFKINTENSNQTAKDTIVTKNKKLQKQQSPEVMNILETEKTKVDNVSLTNTDKALNLSSESSKQFVFNDEPFKDKSLCSKISLQTTTSDKKDKTGKPTCNSKDFVKDKNEKISVKETNYLKETETDLKEVVSKNFENISAELNAKYSLKPHISLNDKKANHLEKQVAVLNSTTDLKVNKKDDLKDTKTAKLDTAKNVTQATPILSNISLDTNSISKSKKEINEIVASPKSKTPPIKNEKDVNGNSSGTIQLISGDNSVVGDYKSSDKIETSLKQPERRLDTNKPNTDESNKKSTIDSTVTIKADKSKESESIKRSKPKIPPPEVLISSKVIKTEKSEDHKKQEGSNTQSDRQNKVETSMKHAKDNLDTDKTNINKSNKTSVIESSIENIKHSKPKAPEVQIFPKDIKTEKPKQPEKTPQPEVSKDIKIEKPKQPEKTPQPEVSKDIKTEKPKQPEKTPQPEVSKDIKTEKPKEPEKVLPSEVLISTKDIKTNKPKEPEKTPQHEVSTYLNDIKNDKPKEPENIRLPKPTMPSPEVLISSKGIKTEKPKEPETILPPELLISTKDIETDKPKEPGKIPTNEVLISTKDFTAEKPPLEVPISSKDIKTDKPKEPEKDIKVSKVKPPPVSTPAPMKFGLCFKYPETIRESSSSDDTDESESDSSSESVCSSEDETAKGNEKYLQDVSRRKLDNGKTSPDRQEKVRTQLSNTSISTTVTNISISSYDDSPRRPTGTQKLKFRPYSIDDFVFLKLLGKGSFGKVLLAELKDHGMHFAIKCLKKDVVLEDDDVESTMIERKILRLGTQHPYMCKLYCTFQTKSYLFFVMEYLNGGDLMFHIQQKSPFDAYRAMFYGAEIVSALKFLHKRGIIYRDIKLDNVMLDVDGHIRLVDFGMCHCGNYNEDCMPCNYCGTPTYIAPEIILGKRYNQSVDWWSFGILLFEMLVGRSPFVGTDEDELFWSICNEEPFYPRFLPKDAKHILENLLIKTPSDRLGMSTSRAGNVEDHPFFSTINWEKLEKKQIPPPFKPTVLSASDTGNFDRSFTMDSPTLSPVESDILESMDQEQFQGFSYTNPHITG